MLRSTRVLVCFLISLGLVVLSPGLSHLVAMANGALQAVISEILDGNEVYVDEQPATVQALIDTGQTIRTAAARAELSANTGAIIRLLSDSSITLGQCAQLTQGTVLITGELTSCTSSLLSGLRGVLGGLPGTIYTLTVDPVGQEMISVFTGELALQTTDKASTFLDNKRGLKRQTHRAASPKQDDSAAHSDDGDTSSDPSDPQMVDLGQGTIQIREGQQLVISPDSDVGFLLALTSTDFANLLAGPLINGFSQNLPGLDLLLDGFQRLFPDLPLPIGNPFDFLPFLF